MFFEFLDSNLQSRDWISRNPDIWKPSKFKNRRNLIHRKRSLPPRKASSQEFPDESECPTPRKKYPNKLGANFSAPHWGFWDKIYDFCKIFKQQNHENLIHHKRGVPIYKSCLYLVSRLGLLCFGGFSIQIWNPMFGYR